MNLKLFRIRKEWSQCDLAIKSGVCRAVISKVENGHIDTVKIGLLKKLAVALDIEVSYLL